VHNVLILDYGILILDYGITTMFSGLFLALRLHILANNLNLLLV